MNEVASLEKKVLQARTTHRLTVRNLLGEEKYLQMLEMHRKKGGPGHMMRRGPVRGRQIFGSQGWGSMMYRGRN